MNCEDCLRRQAAESLRNKKNERIRVNVNPDSEIGREIKYQTAVLKNIEYELRKLNHEMKKKQYTVCQQGTATGRKSIFSEDLDEPGS